MRKAPIHRLFVSSGFDSVGAVEHPITYQPDARVKRFLEKNPIYGDVGIDDDLATFRAFAAWGIPVV